MTQVPTVGLCQRVQCNVHARAEQQAQSEPILCATPGTVSGRSLQASLSSPMTILQQLNIL